MLCAIKFVILLAANLNGGITNDQIKLVKECTMATCQTGCGGEQQQQRMLELTSTVQLNLGEECRAYS